MDRLKLTRSKALVLLISLAVIADLVSTACGIKKPESPSWMTTWDLPLSNHTFSVSELLNDIHCSNIAYDDSGNPFVQFDRYLDTTAVDQSLRLNGGVFNLKDSVGIIEIVPPDSIDSHINLSDIMDISLGFVPPASFDTYSPIDSIDNFTWAHIEQGLLSVAFHNALEIDLDTFVVTLIDSTDMHTIGVLTYQNGLSYLETETQQIDISGQTITNSILMHCHAHTPGGILINAGTQRLESSIFFPSAVTVSSASARVDEFTHVKTGHYEITDSTKAYTAVIYQGLLNMRVSNHTDLPYNVTLHTSNFKLQGLDFSQSHPLPAHDSLDFPIDLAGYTLIPDNGPQAQSVAIDMISTVPSSGTDQYVFHSSDSLNLHVDVSQILLQSVTGRIKPVSIAIDTVNQTLDIPSVLRNTGLTHANLSLTLSNNCMVPAFAEIIVDGDGRSLHLSGYIPGKNSPDAAPVITTLTPGHDELLSFFNPPPTNLTITGHGMINPDYQIVSLSRGDDIWGEVAFNSAMAFVVNDTAAIDPEISRVEIDSRPRDLSYGVFNATVSNHLPVGILLTFFLGQASDSTLFTDPSSVRLGPYHLAAANTDSNGFVSEAVNSTVSDSLGHSALSMFYRDSLFFGQKIELLPTPLNGVVVSGRDNIRVGARARIEMLVGGN